MFYSVCAFEVNLYSFVFTCPFKLLTKSLYIWNHYGKALVTVVVAGPIAVVVLTVC